jgi:ABC-2 type transport system ATP-binding protein
MSIIIQGVSKNYDTQIAVNNISASINKGEIVGFLGPNGAGKSTTMKMITGYLKPTSGLIKVCDMKVQENLMAIKQKIGYLPENNPLYLDMYVREYLEFLANIHKLGKGTQARISEIINTTGLEVEQHKKIGALSKGYKQRVGLAQALLHNPEVLILDEPTSGLDPNQILEIRNLIVNIGQQKTVLLSSHIMQEIEAMCQRVIIINKGNIVADDAIDKLKQNATSNLEIINFTSKQNLPKLFITAAEKLGQINIINEKCLNIQSENINNCKRALLQLSLDYNIDVDQINTQSKSLEDLFRNLTATTAN